MRRLLALTVLSLALSFGVALPASAAPHPGGSCFAKHGAVQCGCVNPGCPGGTPRWPPR